MTKFDQLFETQEALDNALDAHKDGGDVNAFLANVKQLARNLADEAAALTAEDVDIEYAEGNLTGGDKDDEEEG